MRNQWFGRTALAARNLRADNSGQIAVGAMILGVIGVVVVIVVALALLPTISSSVADAQADPNLTAQQGSLVGLTLLFFVIGLAFLGLAMVFITLRGSTGQP